jgi:hypothetical protein
VRIGGVCLPDIDGILTPKDNGGGGGTQASACPEGQMGIPPFCVPNPFKNTGGGAGGGTQQASACPEGQMGIPPFCLPNPFGGAGGSQTQPGTWPLPALCPPGQTFNLPSLSCQGGGQPTTPATCPEGSVLNATTGQCEGLSKASMGLWAAVAVLAAAAVGGTLWLRSQKSKSQPQLDSGVSSDELMRILEEPDEMYTLPTSALANRRRRRR